ncbi:MAG: DUF3224 domain-containing protein [Ktedonobacteraceae bacterium]|nr:DUF3224 domain-containing protein [Ktedonobacteraceae bacterium]
MNCHACGTPLSQGEAHCSRCGAATSYSMTQAAPDDTTMVSTSQNPYEPYQVTQPPPPPPSPQRRGKRTGLIIGAVLLVLLLISVGAFVWHASSAGTPTVATATVGTHAASQHFTAKGTTTLLNSTTVTVQQDGNNQVSRLTQQSISYGDIAGSFTNDETFILRPDKTGTYSGKSTCTCTVAGKSGTLIWSFTGTRAADGSFQGQFFDFHGTGNLARLHGQGTFQGQGDHDTYSSELYFDS